MNSFINSGVASQESDAVRARKGFDRLFVLTGPLRSDFGKTICVFAVFSAVICIIQWVAGARLAGFGGFPDEPAHYMGGLVTRDYFVHGLGRNPIDFVREYYVHLPFFALGVWPPFFYVLEGGWMTIFGCERATVLWIGGISAALIATLLFGILKKQLGDWTAAAASAVFLLVPVVQWSVCLVMADLTCSLFGLVSILFFARFLERRRWMDAALFGFFCGISLLTKNSTYFILLVPVLAIPAMGRWELLRKPHLWVAGLIASAIYMPWLLVSRGFLLLGTYGLHLPGFWGTQLDFVIDLWKQTSFLLPAGLAGIALLLYRRRMSPIAWCILAILPAIPIGIFFARVPVQPRLLVLAYVSLIYFSAQLCAFFPRYTRAAIWTGLIVFGAANWSHFRRPPLDHLHSVVAFVQARDTQSPGAVLLPSKDEGTWVAEFAEFEPERPARILLRPTKVFGEEDWNGSQWRPYYNSVGEIQALFLRIPVKYCILGPSKTSNHYPHDQLLESAVANNPQDWQLVLQTDPRQGPQYKVYQNRHWAPGVERLVYAELSNLLLRKFQR